jgi:hypothetical protein
MVAAQAVLTSKGGATSHAAVVARSMDKTCVVGCGPTLLTIKEGDWITVCGDTGRIWINAEVPVEGGDNGYVETVCGWIFELKGLVPSGPNVWELKGPKVRVTVADWLLAEGDPFTDFADALDQRGTEGVILDLSLPALEPDDLILWEVGCPVDGQIDQFLERVLKRLADYKLKGLTLLGLDPKLKETMEGYGYVVIDSPKTLADVLMADIVMPPSKEFIEKSVVQGPPGTSCARCLRRTARRSAAPPRAFIRNRRSLPSSASNSKVSMARNPRMDERWL